MKIRISYSFVLLSFLSITNGALSQTEVNSAETDTLDLKKNEPKNVLKKTVAMWPVIVPAAMITYGFIKLDNHKLTSIDIEARHEIYSEHPHPKFRVDDYLQFAPGVAVFALNGLGIKGKNKVVDQAGIYLISNIILNSFCQSLKRITDVTRPDGTSLSFPSGHAAEAFASAEFLRIEYNDASSLYSVAGYSAAVVTAYLRIYNNKHWFSDVVAGAGIGILSTKASYWLYPKVKRLFPENNNILILPSYSHGTWGIGMVKIL